MYFPWEVCGSKFQNLNLVWLLHRYNTGEIVWICFVSYLRHVVDCVSKSKTASKTDFMDLKRKRIKTCAALSEMAGAQ